MMRNVFEIFPEPKIFGSADGRPEAARGEERGVGRFDGLAASTATTVREVGINKTE